MGLDAIELARQMALASTGGASNERDDGIKIRIVEIIRGADSIKKKSVHRSTNPCNNISPEKQPDIQQRGNNGRLSFSHREDEAEEAAAAAAQEPNTHTHPYNDNNNKTKNYE